MLQCVIKGLPEKVQACVPEVIHLAELPEVSPESSVEDETLNLGQPTKVTMEFNEDEVQKRMFSHLRLLPLYVAIYIYTCNVCCVCPILGAPVLI